MSESKSAVDGKALAASDTRRALHWVLKVANLKKTLRFYQDVLGLHVLRHEEFSTGCEATCNGPYEGAWSKTMIGFGPERTNFALELTYNYGMELGSYVLGNDLRYIALHPTHPDLGRAAQLAASNGGELVLKDYNGYAYKIVPVTSSHMRTDPFLFASIHVQDLARARDYYTNVLGMREFADVPGARGGSDSVMLGYSDAQAKLELVQLPSGSTLNHGTAFGRIAFATRAGPQGIYELVTRTGDAVQNTPVTLKTPGKADVVVTILKDRDAYEICFVNEDGFDDLSTTKRGDDAIDWEARARKGGEEHPPPLTVPEDAPKLEAEGVVEVETEAAFKEQLDSAAAASRPVVVDYMAPWCRVCRKVFPKFAELAARHPGVKFLKVDTTKLEDLAVHQGVSKLPHFIVYKGSEKVDQLIGGKEAEMTAMVERHA